MSQSRLASFIEAKANVLIGYFISVVAGQIIYPAFGYDVQLHENMAMTAMFVAISFVRSYTFRRFFNWLQTRKVSATED